MAMRSTGADPFPVAKEEVESALRKVRFMHQSWRGLLSSENTAESRAFQDLHAELAGELQQLDYDLRELDASVQVVEQHRDRFDVDDATLAARRAFVRSGRAAHQEIAESLASREAASKIAEDRRKTLLDERWREEQEQQRRANQESERFFQQQQQLQRQLLEQQEDELTELSKNTLRLGHVAQVINGELESQQRMLDELNENMDKELDRMGSVMKGVKQLMQKSRVWRVYGLVIAIALFFILLFLVFTV